MKNDLETLDFSNGLGYLTQQLKTRDNIQRFLAWYFQQQEEELRQARATSRDRRTVPPADIFMLTIHATDYTKESQIRLLEEHLLQSRDSELPFIGLGSHRGYIYRLEPCVYALEPIKDRELLIPDSKEWDAAWCSFILGINLNVEPAMSNRAKPASRRKRSFPDSVREASNKYNVLKGNDATGFVFCVLGNIQHVPPEHWHPKQTNWKNMPWRDSRFALTVKLNEDGSVGGVYALYKFWSFDGDSKTDKERDCDRADWHPFPSLPERLIAGARLGGSITDLRYGKELEFDEIIDTEREIVLAVKDEANNAIIRQTLLEEDPKEEWQDWVVMDD